MKKNGPILTTISFLTYIFIYAPIVMVVVYSFNLAKYGAGWTGFTTKWYAALFRNEMALEAAKNTLILACSSTLVATTLGTLLGVGLSRYNFPGKRLFSWLMYIPLVIPDILMAVSLLLFYGLIRQWLGLFELGMSTMIVSHVTFEIPFVAIVVRARMIGLNPSIEEAAADLGANTWKTFWYVTFPLILPGVLSGALLAFTMSLDDFVVSFFTTGPGATTLPILIYSSVKRGITPDINALSSLMILASIVLTVLVQIFGRKEQERGSKIT
ncbi:MAG: ABC transporter permease [bacterium]|nr:ABC transporter permease [bacterium]